MKHRLIQEVINTIEETEDIKKINLRQIAKRAGCAHTNVYNYFACTEEMLWHAVVPAVELMNSSTVEPLSKVQNHHATERIKLLYKSFIEFAIKHPGLYRFIWLEKASHYNLAPKNLEVMLKGFWHDFLDCIFLRESTLKFEVKNHIGNILFNYLHGEISRLINLRNGPGDPDCLIESILENGAMLYILLMKQHHLMMEERI